MSFTVKGVGHSTILTTLTGSIARDPSLTIILKYSTSETLKEHCSNFK